MPLSLSRHKYPRGSRYLANSSYRHDTDAWQDGIGIYPQYMKFGSKINGILPEFRADISIIIELRPAII
jgi:hypothetical protein